jgi:transposase
MPHAITARELIDRLQIVKNDPLQSDNNITHIDTVISGIQAMSEKLSLNSRNSSKPPSSDLNTEKKSRGNSSGQPRGGQKGHNGSTLEQENNPDVIEELKIDRNELPNGHSYNSNGYIKRQVVDIKISKIITEYRAERLIDDKGNMYVAAFPSGVIQPIQYGSTVKAHATYLSVYQLTPYNRLAEQFNKEYLIPLSTGSISNFISEASNTLLQLGFDNIVKNELCAADSAHADETTVNISGKKHWLHGATNNEWAWLAPHEKRGSKAMDDIAIIPAFNGVLHHDHWSPYYNYTCKHSLCNAHHIRELTRSHEIDQQEWAMEMKQFLLALNEETKAAHGGMLTKEIQVARRKEYQAILLKGDIECSAPPENPKSKRRVKRGKSRNLLERLRAFEDDVLRFMHCVHASFTNNMGEQDLRMSKVRQKISGCFISLESASRFYRVRSYLMTCQKQGISATDGLQMLFRKQLPWPTSQSP